MLADSVEQQFVDLVTNTEPYDKGFSKNPKEEYIAVDSSVLARIVVYTYPKVDSDLYECSFQVFFEAPSEEIRNEYATAVRNLYYDVFGFDETKADTVAGEFMMKVYPEDIVDFRDDVTIATLSIGDVSKECIVPVSVIENEHEQTEYLENISRKLSPIEKHDLIRQGLDPKLTPE